MSSTPDNKKDVITPMPGSFKVNSFTREHDDVCSYNHSYRESVSPGKYMVTNLIPDNKAVIPQALSNPTVIAAEGFGVDMKAIDSDSILRNNPTLEGRAR